MQRSWEEAAQLLASRPCFSALPTQRVIFIDSKTQAQYCRRCYIKYVEDPFCILEPIFDRHLLGAKQEPATRCAVCQLNLYFAANSSDCPKCLHAVARQADLIMKYRVVEVLMDRT